jgi:hypothetical protein
VPRGVSDEEIRERARRLAQAAPPLTPWQREQIRLILRGAVAPVATEARGTGSSDAA